MDCRILKELLNEHNMTQGEFGKAIGVAVPDVYMSKLMHGKIKPSYDTLEAMARVLNVEIGDLFPHSNKIVCPHCGKEIDIIIR